MPYLSWLAAPLGLVPLPPAVLGAITLGYVVTAEAGKRLFYQAMDRPARRPPAGRHHRRLAGVIAEHRGRGQPG